MKDPRTWKEKDYLSGLDVLQDIIESLEVAGEVPAENLYRKRAALGVITTLRDNARESLRELEMEEEQEALREQKSESA